MLKGYVVFHGRTCECPREHLRRFHELIDGIKINVVPQEAIRLCYFSFTIEGLAKTWLDNRAPWSITTWTDMANKFMICYHPPNLK
ncbi:unnamed protein product [Linum trigynum]|uniref:Retrotransposon gag domain-containing protein n=1 Tax=Linum trigynum TaxID=586398 RepID=A0AAV2G745_9ROSI